MTGRAASDGEVRAARVSGRIALVGLVLMPVLYLVQLAARALLLDRAATLGELLLFLTWLGVLVAAAMAVLGGLTWFVMWLVRKLA